MRCAHRRLSRWPRRRSRTFLHRQSPDSARALASPAIGDTRVWHLWSLIARSEPITADTAVRAFRAKRGRRPVVREARPEGSRAGSARDRMRGKGVAGSLSFPSVERHPTVLVRLEDEFG
jgi:hypothetical protein